MTGGAFKNNSNLLGRRREIEELEKSVGILKKELEETQRAIGENRADVMYFEIPLLISSSSCNSSMSSRIPQR